MHLFSRKSKRIYLDYAASSPVDPSIEKRMRPYWSTYFGNAGGLHEEGRHAKKVVTESREHIAESIGVHADEIIFTASGTEGNSLALFGFISKLREKEGGLNGVHLIVSSAEHPSVLDCFRSFEKEGAQVSFVDFNEKGILTAEKVEVALTPQTRFISIAYVNNEIGTVQPIKEIAQKVRAYEKKHGIQIVFHTDASQAPLYLDCSPHTLGVDLMTIDAQKIYGPKGVGFLYKSREVPIHSIMKGGNQEFGLRPGTENTPLIIGMAESFVNAVSRREQEVKKIKELQDHFITAIEREVPQAVLNGDRVHRSPSNVNISVAGVDNEYLVIALDEKGIALATKSACIGYGNGTSSYVVASLSKEGAKGEKDSGNISRAQSSLRFSIGKHITKKDLDYVAKCLAEEVAKVDKSKNK